MNTTQFAPLLDRVTEKLQRDPELRQEVRHELLTHLDECAQEFLAAGLTDREAHSKAIESFGNEDEVANRLYQANRQRMKVRTAVRWAGRIGLAPVAVAVLAPLTVTTVASVLTVLAVLGFFSGMGLNVSALRSTETSILSKLSDSDRALVEIPDGTPTALQKATQLLARSPNDPVLYGNYATFAFAADAPKIDLGSKENPQAPDLAAVDRLCAILDQGEKIEPQNAYYPLLKAAALFQTSARELDEPEDQQPGFAWTDNHDKPTRVTLERYQILNPALFSQALTAFHNAAGKPYLNDHSVDFLKRQMSVLPKPTTLREGLYEMSVQIATLLPQLNTMREVINAAAGASIQQAEAGHREAALNILADCKSIAALHRTNNNAFLIQLIVAYGIHSRVAALEVVIDDQLKLSSTVARDRLLHAEQIMTSARSGPNGPYQEHVHQFALIENRLTPGFVDWTTIDTRPERLAEYAVTDQMAIVAISALLLAMAAVYATGMLIYRWQHGTWPLGLYLGWKRLAGILTIAVVAPVGLYAIYLLLSDVRDYGLPSSYQRQAIEYALVGGAICVLLRLTLFHFLRMRTQELGYEPPPAWRPSAVEIALGAFILAGTIAFWIYWRTTVDRTSAPFWHTDLAWVVIVALALYSLTALRPVWSTTKNPDPTVNHLFRVIPFGAAIVALAIVIGSMILGIAYSDYSFTAHVLVFAFPVLAGTLLLAAAALGIKRYLSNIKSPMVGSSPSSGTFSASAMRASIPLLMLAALLLTSVVGSIARWNERRWASHFEETSMNWLDEVSHSRMRILKDAIGS